MGGLCSKEAVLDAPPPAAPVYAHAFAPVRTLQKASSQSLRDLIALAPKNEGASPVISRTESNAKPVKAATNNNVVGAIEKTAPPVVVIALLGKSYSTAGAPTHHRRDTGCGAQEISSLPQGFSGEHVIAGWPSWLTSVAGEVVEGWLPRRADTFERLDKIGQGTYSNVCKARDLETGKIMALKRVRFVNMAAPAQDAIADYQRRRQARTNQKSTSHHHYRSQEDSVLGFRIKPPAVARGGPATMQTAGFGSTWYRNDKAVSRTSSSVRVPHPSSSVARDANSRYNRLDVAEPANAMGWPGSSHKMDAGMRDASSGFGGAKNKRIHYSGPLMPPGGNMEDMLREHERLIQEAARKAWVEKEKTNRNHY